MGTDLDLRPQLERLDRLTLRSAGLDPGALSFAFRPLWQRDAASAAAIALQKAQATQVYAGLGLWPAEVPARLVEAQLVQDGTHPNAAAVFATDEARRKPPGYAARRSSMRGDLLAPWVNHAWGRLALAVRPPGRSAAPSDGTGARRRAAPATDST